eukprot:10933177-Ditylum_brightwellii.AAC.1
MAISHSLFDNTIDIPIDYSYAMKSQRVLHNPSCNTLKDLVDGNDKSVLTASLSSSSLSDAVGDGAKGDDATSTELLS